MDADDRLLLGLRVIGAFLVSLLCLTPVANAQSGSDDKVKSSPLVMPYAFFDR